MDDLKKMTKAQLIEELIRVRNAARDEPCGCCGITPKEWEETPLLDPVEPEQPFTEEAPIFIPTCWPAGEIEELEEEDEDE